MIASLFPPAPEWTSSDIPDLKEKVALVTGANCGIGFETTLALARKSCKVFLGCRDSQRAADAIILLKKILDRESLKGYELVFLKLDLASLESVKAAGNELASQTKRLDMVLCSAGLSAPKESMRTSDNIEIHMGVNVLGHFYLIQQLLPLLLRTVPLAPMDSVRVVFTSSSTAVLAAKFGSFDIKDPILDRKNNWLMSKSEEFTVVRRYSHSKLCNILLSNKLSREFENQGIVFSSVDPGGIKTELTRNVFGISYLIVKLFLNPFILYPASMGALTQLYAATSVEAGESGGKYLVPWARMGKAPKEAEDLKAQDDLYTWCQQQVQGR